MSTKMPLTSQAIQRYPKRKRTAVSYKDDDDAFDPENLSSEVDEEWRVSKQARKKKKNKKKKNKKKKNKKKKNACHAKEKSFPFFELPGEIRNEIYKYAVTNTGNLVYIKSQSLTNTRSRRFLSEKVDEEFSAYFWRRWRHRDTRNKFRNLRLLRVCKTMYRESADFIYGQRFKFYRLVTLQTFLLLLRPATLARLRHVKVCLGDSEWQLLPMFSTHLIQLINLTTLKITDINTDICRKNFVSYLQRTDRPLSSWEITGDSLDKLNGIKLARDIYPFMFPFFKMMVRDNGIGRLVQMVDFRYQENYSCLGKEQIYRGLWVASPFDRFKARRITDERRLLMRTAMGEEIIRLMEEDSF